MPEIRRDYLTGEWVSISSERSKRPLHFEKFTHIHDEKCVFCPENRHLIPKPLYVSEDGSVLAVPNKYPILSQAEAQGYGIHEVVIDTLRHDEKFHCMSISQLMQIFKCIKSQIIYTSKDEQIKYVQVFKNSGAEAGASISHSHWQLLAMSIVPSRQETIFANAKKYFNENNQCYFCHMIEELGSFKIDENSEFVAFAPYASRFSYEIDIVSKSKTPDFSMFDESQLMQLATILKRTLNALMTLLEDIDYNICFYNSSTDSTDLKDIFHFYLQIIPRIGNLAGCEFSTGMYTNSVYPEDAAQLLSAKIAELY